MPKKIVRLTEFDLTNIIKNVIEEQRNVNEIILPNINYNYWKDKADSNTENPENGTFATMVTTLKNNLPKGSIILKYLNDPKEGDHSMKKIIDKAVKLADEYRDTTFYKNKDSLNLPPSVNESSLSNFINQNVLLLGIFDAIMGWGGNSIRMFYNNENSNRKKFEKWLHHYKEAIELVKEGDFKTALHKFDDIPGIDISFASKHLWFWGFYWKSRGYLSDKETTHVYDTRIARILFGKKAEVTDYDLAEKEYSNIRKKYNLDDYSFSDIEKSLFSFSNQYFNNELTQLMKGKVPLSRDEVANSKDGTEALRIFDIRKNESNKTPSSINKWQYVKKDNKEKPPEQSQELPKSKTFGNLQGSFYVEKDAIMNYPWVKSYLTNIPFTSRNSGKDYWEVKPKKAKELFSKLTNN